MYIKALRGCFFRQESDDIVRFVSLLADGGHVQAFQYLQNPRHRPFDVFRRLIAVRFVLGIRFVAERPRGHRIQRPDARGLVANDVEQRVGKPKMALVFRPFELIRGFLMKA